MRFDLGVLDGLFGEKLDVEIPGSDGQIIKRTVSKKWLEQMAEQGSVKELKKVRVHLLHSSHGYSTEERMLECDSPFLESIDKETGDLFIVTFFRDGSPESHFLTKSQFNEARRTFDSVG